MKKYIIYLGLNDKDKKVQIINTLEAYKIAMNIVLKKTDGATIFEAFGYYKHADGTIVTEMSLRIELMFVQKNDVIEIVNTLKNVFNQESIILQEQNILSELI